MDPFESIKQTFFQECDELLTDAEQGLLAMEAGDADSETINAVFRAVHSVKGGAGAFGLEDLIRFAHVFETVMDELRSGKMELTDEVAKTLLRAFDVLADHVAAARDGTMVDEARSAGMLSELKSLIGEDGLADDGDLGDDDDFGFVPMAVSIDDDAPPAMDFDLPPPVALEPEPAVAAGGVWVIDFAPKTEMYAKANEAGLLLRELARLGETQVTLDDSDLPPLDQIAAESAYLRWTIRLTTEQDEASIREVFEFVEDDCILSIVREGGDEPAPKVDLPLSDDDLAKASAEAPLDLAALLARVSGDAPAAAIEPEFVPEPAPEPAADLDVAALIARAQAETTAAAPPPAPTPVAAAPAPAPAAAKAAAPANAPAAPAQATIRVDLDRVDRLINAVGELVIQQAMLSQRVLESGWPARRTWCSASKISNC